AKAAKAAAARKSGKRTADDDEPLPRWKRGVLIAASIVGLSWLGSTALGWFRAKPGPLAADVICQAFHANPEGAKRDYEGQVLEIAGSVKVIEVGQLKKVVFDTPYYGSWVIHCDFADPNVASKVFESIRDDPDPALTVKGRCKLPHGDGIIVM